MASFMHRNRLGKRTMHPETFGCLGFKLPDEDQAISSLGMDLSGLNLSKNKRRKLIGPTRSDAMDTETTSTHSPLSPTSLRDDQLFDDPLR
jgi:hypothetical protein